MSAGYLDAIDGSTSWIRRQTETIQFESANLIRRTSMLEILLSADLSATLPTTADGRTAVPVAILDRALPDSVKVREVSHDGAVHRLTRGEERSIVARGIADRGASSVRPPYQWENDHWNSLTSEQRSEELFPLILKCIDEIELENERFSDEATERALQRLQDSCPEAVFDTAIYMFARTIGVLLDLQGDHTRTVIEESHIEETTYRRGTLWLLAQAIRDRRRDTDSYQARFLNPLTRDRSLLTVVENSATTFSQSTNGRHALKAYRGLMRLRYFFVPDSLVYLIPVEDALAAESLHIRLGCPQGCYIESAFLRVDVTPIDAEGVLNELVMVPDDDLHSGEAHFYFSRRLPRSTSDGLAFQYADLRVIVRPTFHNGLRAGCNVAAFSTLLLFALFATVGWVAWGKEPFGPLEVSIDAHPDVQSLVTLLLLGPGLLLSWIVRRDEHEVEKLAYAGYRRRLAIIGGLLFFQALVLALGVSGPGLALSLATTSCVSGIFTLWSFASGLYSRSQGT